VPREKFSSQASPEILGAMREIARKDGRHFQAVLEEALQEYIENRAQEKPRASVMARFQASVERNRRLGELLAK
jgi:predicted transcriptional regulator